MNLQEAKAHISDLGKQYTKETDDDIEFLDVLVMDAKGIILDFLRENNLAIPACDLNLFATGAGDDEENDQALSPTWSETCDEIVTKAESDPDYFWSLPQEFVALVNHLHRAFRWENQSSFGYFCPKYNKEMVRITKETLDKIKTEVKPNFNTLQKMEPGGMYKICPGCDKYALGAELIKRYDVIDAYGEITDIEKLGIA